MKIADPFISLEKCPEYLSRLGQEFSIIRNPDYVHPEFEIVPLAPKFTGRLSRLRAAVMDMDGTTTSTEPICIHSLEYMVRLVTNRTSALAWSGLDHDRDYPYIIGNSTTRHVEYLLKTYQQYIDPQAFRNAYIRAAVRTLRYGKDPQRIHEVRNNLINLGLAALLTEPSIASPSWPTGQEETIVAQLISRFNEKCTLDSFADTVRAAIDIYYDRYHTILAAIQRGEGAQIATEVLTATTATHFIEPMPGVAEFIALVRGWLGAEAINLIPQLKQHLTQNAPGLLEHLDMEATQKALLVQSRYFEAHPAKVAVVTSSITYEADIVLAELFRVIRQKISYWPLSESLRQRLTERFQDYRTLYDTVVTATDSSEIRLKPHRDLYSIALHQLGIPKQHFNQVIGFEDSESGTIAIRAAGIGLSCAVPFSQTRNHNFAAATHILKGGLPELILIHHLFTH